MKTYIIAHLQTPSWKTKNSNLVILPICSYCKNQQCLKPQMEDFLLLFRLPLSSSDTATTRLTAHFMWSDVWSGDLQVQKK